MQNWQSGPSCAAWLARIRIISLVVAVSAMWRPLQSPHRGFRALISIDSVY
jgi:hypothetical protein